MAEEQLQIPQEWLQDLEFDSEEEKQSKSASEGTKLETQEKNGIISVTGPDDLKIEVKLPLITDSKA